MTDVMLRTWPVGHLVILRGALDEAVRSLSKIERTPAVKACLADKLLTLAASGEIDPVRLSKAALNGVQGSCATCRGCDGISPPSQQTSMPLDKIDFAGVRSKMDPKPATTVLTR